MGSAASNNRRIWELEKLNQQANQKIRELEEEFNQQVNQKIRELEEEFNQQVNQKNRELEEEFYRQVNQKFRESEEKFYQYKNYAASRIQELEKELNQYKKNYVARDFTVADIKKQTPVIIPGEPTRGDTAGKYEEQTTDAIYDLPKRIKDCKPQKLRQYSNSLFQEAYDTCKHHLLEEFKMKLETLVKMPANRRCLSADEEECHSDVQRAYGLLLSACKMKGRPAPVQAADEVRVKCKEFEPPKRYSPLYNQVINGAVSVAWDMLTLSPPAVLCTPEKYFQEWQEITNDVKKRYFTLKYYRPLMLSHAHGPPVVKGMVIKVASSKPTVNQEGDSKNDEESESEDTSDETRKFMHKHLSH